MHARKLRGFVRLTRYQDHILFTIPVTLFGINLASSGGSPDHILSEQGVLVLAANILAVTFAFMINDVEDAPDDMADESRRSRNAIAVGTMTPREGWIASILVALLSLLLFAWLGGLTLGVGLLILGLGLLYSWRQIRLKAIAMLDIVSHALMLSSLLFITGHIAFKSMALKGWLAALCVGLISAYGQLYNQLRDFDADQQAGLHNTADVIGPRYSHILMYLFLLLALAFFLIALALGTWPLWLGVLAVVLTPLLVVIFPKTDLRQSQAIDLSGRAQLGFVIISNLVMVAWSLELILSNHI